MNIKFCPDCGISLEDSPDVCPCCGLEDLNRVFESKDEYLSWHEKVLKPRKWANRIPTQVFAGHDHALILRSTGELYAIGLNFNGCCGENQPGELFQFTCIARGVIHAAAGKDHTIYVSRNGKVTLLGRSRFVDEFQCDFPVRHVYADSHYDAFWLEDTQGNYYFFGNRWATDNVQKEEVLLRKLPRLCIRKKRYCAYNEHAFEAHERFQLTETILSGSDVCTNNPEVQEAMESDWYHSLVEEYGEGNIGIKLGDIVDSKNISHRTIPNGKDYDDYEDIVDYYYEPEVVYTNHMIFKPTPCIRNEDVLKNNCFSGCWPKNPITHIPYEKQLTKCFRFFHSSSYREILVLKDTLDQVTFYENYETYNPDWSMKGVADLAVSPYQSKAYHRDLILVVSNAGNVYVGPRDALEEASRGKKQRIYLFQKRPDPWSLLEEVKFT